MTAEALASWYTQRGLKVVKSASCYWHLASHGVFQAFPYDDLIDPPEDELSNLLTKTGAVALRYSTPIAANIGRVSYHVIAKPGYSLDRLPRKARWDVKHGMRSATFGRIPFARLADEGWRLRSDTLARQDRVASESRDWWVRLCEAANAVEGFCAWGAIVGGELAASALTFSTARSTAILFQQSRTIFLKLNVNNALAHVMTDDALNHAKRQHVFYGMESLDAGSSVDAFKFRMGFAALPIRQRIVFHPRIERYVTRWAVAAVLPVLRVVGGQHVESKARGLFETFLDGRRPIERQNWPACLRDAPPSF